MRGAAVALILLAAPALAADLAGIPRIVDGDTVELGGVKIRLEGIDAPETDQVCPDAHGRRLAGGDATRTVLERHADGWAEICRPEGP